MADLARGAPERRTKNVDALETRVCGRAALTLATLRFLTHPALRAVFPEYLIDLYHSMRTAGAVMESARDRSTALADHCPVAARLAPYWANHVREESGHDEWLLADLARLGVNVDRAVARLPAPEVAELMGTLHFWIRHAHPVGALSYFYVVERSPPTEALLDRIVQLAGIPREALQTFYRHASIDVAHARDLEALIDSLPLTPDHLDLMGTSATTVVRQLTRIYEQMIQRADAVLAQPRSRPGQGRRAVSSPA